MRLMRRSKRWLRDGATSARASLHHGRIDGLGRFGRRVTRMGLSEVQGQILDSREALAASITIMCVGLRAHERS
jgi:hypothetical protein